MRVPADPLVVVAEAAPGCGCVVEADIRPNDSSNLDEGGAATRHGHLLPFAGIVDTSQRGVRCDGSNPVISLIHETEQVGVCDQLGSHRVDLGGDGAWTVMLAQHGSLPDAPNVPPRPS